uniref:G-protein coupled receptors family 2 profile 2 domain-containing protein n=1 Tax=Panagrolaimus sp. PS1159 TaxID=55785 RepID=A0AC35FSI7_9BILA
MAVAIISYWLLMSCIMLSLFNSWRIIKEHVKGTTMDKFFGRITVAKVIYPVTFSFSTLLAMIFGFSTSGKFFYRNDSLCWVRPDYKLAIIIPFTILGLSAIICVSIMTIRRFTILEKYFTVNRVKTINRANSPNIKTRLFVLFLTQFNLGAPWLLQYFTLFSPNATIWHFLFVIFNGSQGIVIFIAFIYRCYMESKQRKVKENTIKQWKKSRKNAKTLQIPAIIKEFGGNERRETIAFDENCIQIISRESSQILDDGREINIRRTNAKRNLTDIQGDQCKNGELNDTTLNHYLNGGEIILQPDQLRISTASSEHNNRHTSKTILPDVIPYKQPKDLLKFDYVIDRVGSRVMRVYKDSDHSFYYNDIPQSK